MRCSCPKCSANITPELHDIPDEGSFTKCPECGAGFLLRKESFARRALHKGNTISCANCGGELGPSIYCPGCSTLYPDYLVTETSSAAKRQMGKIMARFKNLLPAHKTTVAHHDTGITTSKPRKGLKLPGQPLQIAVILIAIVAVIASGGVYYYKQKVESEFTENYIRALFGIKSSADMGLKICTRVTSDWKTNPGLTPKLTGNEALYLKRGKEDIDRLLKRIVKVPEKFAPSHTALLGLNEIHLKINAAASAPSGTADSYAYSVGKLDEEFRKSAKQLKNSLPPRLAEGFEESKIKYKALTDI